MDQATKIDHGVFFEFGPAAQMVFTPDLRVVAVNRPYCDMLGRQPEAVIGQQIFDAFPPNPEVPVAEIKALLRTSAAQVMKTGVADEMPLQQHGVADAAGPYSIRYWRLIHSPVFTDREAPASVSHIILTAEDVTRIVLGNRISEAKRRAATRGTEVTYFEFHPVEGRLTRTPEFDSMFGFSADEIGDALQPFFDRIHPDDRPDVTAEVERVARTVGSELRNDYRVVWPNGIVRWLVSRGEAILDPVTQNICIVGILLDVTAIKENEARLREAINTRDLLISEVNHRVKNSLQMVTSILNLEAQQAKDALARACLHAASARVQAVAAIHSSLYEDDNVRSVQIDQYLQRLSDHLRISLSDDQESVRIVLAVEPMRLSIDKAVTLSLAVNELVTNAFKHAFPEGGEGTVTVELRRNESDKIMLEVADNGTGPGSEMLGEGRASPGLGKRLIAGMAAQLGGTIEINHEHGWRTRIIFPE